MANISTKLSIYSNGTKTIMNLCGCVRDGEGHARPSHDHGFGGCDYRRCRRSAGQGSRSSDEPAADSDCSGRACVRRSCVAADAGRRPGRCAREAARCARHDLPLRRRPASRAAGAGISGAGLFGRDILPLTKHRNFPVAYRGERRPIKGVRGVRVVHQLTLGYAHRGHRRRSRRR